uniref:Secreted protein n=1 Tax=Streptomyces sp. NBC_00093 TaxID=2975649 RepID=A0AAU1ZVG4_9ACTN
MRALNKQLMRGTRVLGSTLFLSGLAVTPAVADETPSPSPSDGSSAPTSAGTSFRTATEIDQGEQATASGSAGDYLYWSFPADAGQRPTVRATVKLPDTHASEAWQLDVYDGLRRRQACQYGAQTRTAAAGTASVELACTLRTVRAWSEQWANDPLPGTYYVRLTAVNLPTSDLGLPVEAELRVDSKDIGGSAAVDGSLAEPLVPGIAVKSEDTEDSSTTSAVLSSIEPDDGWASGWWSDRWVWTAIGGALAALAGVGGYALTRGSGRPRQVPPGV